MPARKAARPADAPPAKPTRKKAAAKPKEAPADGGAPRPKAKASGAEAAPRAPVERHRVVFPRDWYEGRKDEVKAPLKEKGLKWQFLGEGKGRYHAEGVNVFVQWTDRGVDFTVWGADEATVRAVLDAWRALLGAAGWAQATAQGTEAVAEEKAEAESEAMRLWRLQEPQRRPGEPEFFFKKRTDEWMAKRPAS